MYECKGELHTPLLRMDRSVKLAQQVLNRMVVLPSSPSTGCPLLFFRLAVTVRDVTPTETQLPCRQKRSVLRQHKLNIVHVDIQHCKGGYLIIFQDNY